MRSRPSDAPKPPRLTSFVEYGRTRGIAPNTLRDLYARGVLPVNAVIRLPGCRRVFLDFEVMDRWLDSQREGRP